jgi:hypothetical protein
MITVRPCLPRTPSPGGSCRRDPEVSFVVHSFKARVGAERRHVAPMESIAHETILPKNRMRGNTCQSPPYPRRRRVPTRDRSVQIPRSCRRGEDKYSRSAPTRVCRTQRASEAMMSSFVTQSADSAALFLGEILHAASMIVGPQTLGHVRRQTLDGAGLQTLERLDPQPLAQSLAHASLWTG